MKNHLKVLIFDKYENYQFFQSLIFTKEEMIVFFFSLVTQRYDNSSPSYKVVKKKS